MLKIIITRFLSAVITSDSCLIIRTFIFTLIIIIIIITTAAVVTFFLWLWLFWTSCIFLIKRGPLAFRLSERQFGGGWGGQEKKGGIRTKAVIGDTQQEGCLLSLKEEKRKTGGWNEQWEGKGGRLEEDERMKAMLKKKGMKKVLMACKRSQKAAVSFEGNLVHDLAQYTGSVSPQSMSWEWLSVTTTHQTLTQHL